MKKDWKEEVLADVKAELEAMEAAGEAPKDVAELEAITLGFSQRISQQAWEKWMQARAEKASFSPSVPSLLQEDE